jgi:hypothetical protein|tara:strand:- start:33809 stop:34777 length:969 start_codon:yes stop_codon:yes gene_type:complete
MKTSLYTITVLLLSNFTQAQTPSGNCYLGGYELNLDADNSINSSLNGILYGPTDTTDRNGNSQSAYYFDGVDDYIKIPHTGILDSINQEFTLTMWIQPEDQFYNTLLAKGGSNILIQLVKNQRPAALYPGTTLNYDGVENYYSRAVLHDVIPTDKWTFMAFTYSNISKTYAIYIDGVEYLSNACEGTLRVDTTSLYIGKRNNIVYPEHFKGKMDQIEMYCSALSGTKIERLYQGESLSVNELKDSKTLNIYPNPSSTQINIPISRETESINLYNSLGQRTEYLDLPNSPYLKIDVSAFSSGIYTLITLDRDGLKSTAKFVKN